MKLFAIRYFAIKSSLTLFPIEDVAPKDFFILPFLNKEEVKYYGKTYTSRIIKQVNQPRYIIGYLLKSKDTHFIHLEKDLFDESEILNWEKLFFIIDKERQLFVCEYNTTVASPANIKNVLTNLTRKFNLDGYEIKLDFLVDEFVFWNIINESVGLYQIAFDLTAPNLFGGSKKANEWLTKLKEKHNMTTISFDIRNENSELNYDAEELESYRDYADSGGGNWTLGILQNNHRKKRYSSANHIKTKEVDFEPNHPNEVRKSIDEIIKFLTKVIKELDKENEK